MTQQRARRAEAQLQSLRRRRRRRRRDGGGGDDDVGDDDDDMDDMDDSFVMHEHAAEMAAESARLETELAQARGRGLALQRAVEQLEGEASECRAARDAARRQVARMREARDEGGGVVTTTGKEEEGGGGGGG